MTDLDRDSIRTDPAVEAAIAAGVERDGPSTGSLFLDEVSWSRDPADGRVDLRLGAHGIPMTAKLLAGRLRTGGDLVLLGPDQQIAFEPGDTYGTWIDDTTLIVTLPPATAARLAEQLRPVAGSYPVAGIPDLTVHVERSLIRDASGTIVEVIG